MIWSARRRVSSIFFSVFRSSCSSRPSRLRSSSTSCSRCRQGDAEHVRSRYARAASAPRRCEARPNKLIMVDAVNQRDVDAARRIAEPRCRAHDAALNNSTSNNDAARLACELSANRPPRLSASRSPTTKCCSSPPRLALPHGLPPQSLQCGRVRPAATTPSRPRPPRPPPPAGWAFGCCGMARRRTRSRRSRRARRKLEAPRNPVFDRGFARGMNGGMADTRRRWRRRRRRCSPRCSAR